MDDPDPRHTREIGIVDVGFEDWSDFLCAVAAEINFEIHVRGGGSDVARRTALRAHPAGTLQIRHRLAELHRPHLDFGVGPVDGKDLASLTE
jgi:hypothetical protein